jgi:hypothetical protein
MPLKARRAASTLMVVIMLVVSRNLVPQPDNYMLMATVFAAVVVWPVVCL